MPKLLTIAIPSYNRAQRLARQLEWLARELRGREADVEVVLSDNCSPDGTPQVMHTWRDRIGPDLVSVHRNRANIGALRNVTGCVHRAGGRFVWLVGDDDEIADGTVGFVLDALKSHPELASVLLNFRSVGKTVYDRCFSFEADGIREGKKVVEQALNERYFGLAFMTAQLYRTDLARAVMLSWPEGVANYDYQIFITAGVAAKGKVFVTREPRVTYVTGVNVYETNPKAAMRVTGDSSEVMVKLVQMGYSRPICARLVRLNARRFNHRFLGKAVCRPAEAPAVVWRYLRSLVRVHTIPPGLPSPVDLSAIGG